MIAFLVLFALSKPFCAPPTGCPHPTPIAPPEMRPMTSGEYPALMVGGCAPGDMLMSIDWASTDDEHWYLRAACIVSRPHDRVCHGASCVTRTDGIDGEFGGFQCVGGLTVIAPQSAGIWCIGVDERGPWGQVGSTLVEIGLRRVRAWSAAALVFVGGQRAAGRVWTFVDNGFRCDAFFGWTCNGSRSPFMPYNFEASLPDPGGPALVREWRKLRQLRERDGRATAH